ncbi:MAG TPA: hypothetical protein DEA97_21550 [Bacteroidales bacterium]|nr:hypothetical protein [Bacteroidales bacterium]HBS89147.1 hypothetical protein [Bacteroidales bacterium]
MDAEYIFGTIISALLSVNGFFLRSFVSSVKELKKVIQDLAIAVRLSQRDIEYINKELDSHSRTLEKHDNEIDQIKKQI